MPEIPVHPAREYPWFTHAGGGVWHTLCEHCGERITGTDHGNLTSNHASHVTRTHGLEPLPVGTLVRVTPHVIRRLDGSRTQQPPYRAIVRGYDIHRTKYHVSPEHLPGVFTREGLRWPFLDEVQPAEG